MLTTSLAPNTQADDMCTAILSLLTPWHWHQANRLTKAANRLQRLFPGHKVALTSSGRAAIYQALRALNIGSGDEVIIQAFTCLAVPAAIQWTGAKPVYTDISRADYNLAPDAVLQKITARTRAIIIQHTFGIPGPLLELQKIAADHNLLLIEDLAHGLGSEYRGQKLGTFGRAAILSFGRDKAISSVFGGAVISRDRQLITKISLGQQQLRYPPTAWTIQQLLHPILVPLFNYFYFTASLGKISLVAAQKLRLLSLAVSPAEKLGAKPKHATYRFSPALTPLLGRQIGKLPKFIKHRRHLARLYTAALPHNFTAGQMTGTAWLRFPLQIKNRDQFFVAARRQKILLGDWYRTPVAPCSFKQANVTGYVTGSCPVAEEVSRAIINLPTHIKVSEQQAQQIVSLIKNYNADKRNS